MGIAIEGLEQVLWKFASRSIADSGVEEHMLHLGALLCKHASSLCSSAFEATFDRFGAV